MNVMASGDFSDANIRLFNPGNLRRVDWPLSLLVLSLAFIGVVALYSANRSDSGANQYYLRQMMFIPVGVVFALFVSCIDYRALVSLGPLAYVLLVGFLIAVLLAGEEAKGATRWLRIGPVRFQPSEQAKLAVILMLTWYFSLVGPRIQRFHYFVLTFVIVAVPGYLILTQPNLGTAATLGPITVAMLYVAGCRRRHLVAVGVAGVAAIPLAWAQLKDYQRVRVLTFLDPASDAQNDGWQTIQSMITVGSGGLSGKGYREGTQTYLSYLPEHHTDFIFSLLAEEFGFLGSTVVVVLFLLLFFRGLGVARNSQDIAGALLAVGIVTLLAFHVFVNIAITVGIAPVTGIPLPFLSWGRSFYLTTMLCMGLLLSVNSRRGFFDR